MKISIRELRSSFEPHIFKRGQRYYQEGRVEIISLSNDSFTAEVAGTDVYEVKVWSNKNDDIQGECTCPYWDNCKHMVAAVLEARECYEFGLQPENENKSGWQNYLTQIGAAEESQTTKRRWQLLYTLGVESDGWTLSPQKRMIKKDGAPGVPRNLADDDFGKPEIERSRNDNLVLSFLEKRNRTNSFYNAYHGDLALYKFDFGADVGVIFDLLRESRVYFSPQDGKNKTLIYHDSLGKIEFRLLEEKDGMNFCPYLLLDNDELVLDHNFCVLTSEPVFLLRDNEIIEIAGKHDAKSLIPFTRKDYRVLIPKEEVSEFFGVVALQKDIFNHFRLPDEIETESISEITEKRLYLSDFDEGMEIQLKFCYGPVEVEMSDPRQSIWAGGLKENKFVRITRDRKAEEDAHNLLLNSNVKVIYGERIYTRKNKTVDWLYDEIPKLLAAGFVVYGEENLKQFKINRSAARVSVNVTSGIDWFDLELEIDIGGVLVSLAEIKKALKKKDKYIKLADGSLAKLPQTWLNRFRHAINLGEENQKGLRLSQFHVTLIDELFAEAHQKNVDKVFSEKLERLKNFNGIKEVKVPSGLQGSLRPYQSTGYSWLNFLREYEFGGCLADDMGLGKTIQALAILLREVENGVNEPNLIVTPTSVVFNWLNEIEKFAPALKALNQTGVDRKRTNVNYDDYDIVLTSYGTLRHDVIFLKDVQFNYVILDESQNIKNPVSQTAKAVKLLKAKHRLALTGTPIENNTIELWSLFSFLNPGLLGNLNYFKNAFAKPIEKERDQETAALLKKTIFPFMLRRTKDKVAPELPPKVESILYAEMTPEHEKVYNKWRDYYRSMLLKQIADSGLNKSRMNVLGGLMKLRQIACHPILVEKTFAGKVTKYDMLFEYLEELLAEGHKVLVFSQFVKMLTIIRRYLDSAKISYEYLDGRTRNRKRCVEKFQEDKACKIFLISLKAGGTGLNLTAADYVIHYDPWWNPAVEAQATDRIHRIGQDKHVFVYKMITRNTVEEKILQLQDRKRQLVADIITTDTGLFKKLTVKDIEDLFS